MLLFEFQLDNPFVYIPAGIIFILLYIAFIGSLLYIISIGISDIITNIKYKYDNYISSILISIFVDIIAFCMLFLAIYFPISSFIRIKDKIDNKYYTIVVVDNNEEESIYNHCSDVYSDAIRLRFENNNDKLVIKDYKKYTIILEEE